MGITQKDIARKLGVSLITVQRALNNSGYVSKKLKHRILEYTKKVNYVPHKASQVLVRNRVRNIAVFSSSLPRYFWNDLRTGIDIGAEQILPFDYQVRYHMIPESDSKYYLKTLKQEINNGLEAAAFVNQWIYDMRSIISMIDHAAIPYVTVNVDAPESRRMCYIGPDYQAGGRLAAEYIGKALQFKKRARILVINTKEAPAGDSDAPDINQERLEGFLEVMGASFPSLACEVEYITARLRSGRVDSQIEGLLKSKKGSVQAVYLIPAFNSPFLRTLEKLDYRNIITVLHDLDSSANHHLETQLLSAVIYQNPILQGYHTVKTLEHILESGQAPRTKRIEIVHSLILAENRDLFRNHYLLMKLLE